MISISIVKIPNGWKELHHEVELGVVIGKEGKNIREDQAMDHVLGYVLALDMTARKVQEELKKVINREIPPKVELN